jgi:hypothetical protein
MNNLHDENGDDIQLHFVGGDAIISFSDKWALDNDWLPDDTLQMSVCAESGSLSIVNKSLNARKFKIAVDQTLSQSKEW